MVRFSIVSMLDKSKFKISFTGLGYKLILDLEKSEFDNTDGLFNLIKRFTLVPL